MIAKLIRLYETKPWVRNVVRGLAMGLMLALIFYYLSTKDFSTSPDFIYNQF